MGVTGGIAAYKAAELTRLWVKRGLSVQVLMTEAATRFVTPTTFQALSGKPVFTDLWDARPANAMGHIELGREVDALVVAPASANFLARLAQGFTDDLLSTVCLARECPLLVAPAMNRQMWANPATQRNVARLRDDGVVFLGPAWGDQACGEVGEGRMLEAEEIVAAVEFWAQPKILAGRRVLLTAGPTFEAIDPVRGITNLSSGKMGYALARAAAQAGAEVTLVSGPVGLPTPAGVQRIDVRSAADMLAAVEDVSARSEIFIAVAAVADYTPTAPLPEKLKKSTVALQLELMPTVDILARIAAGSNPPFCVGFAAESERVLEFAEAKRRRKKLPLIIANNARDAIGSDDNEVTLLDAAGAHALPRLPKEALARRLIEEIARRYLAVRGAAPDRGTP
ncbi:MAG: bifunctional phosphopantothenoylcysteine decarboxylase/phosphopantothenate--cysteine ligase CoaBC [Betaproteobacteria bacterium]|nr:bifunctional phosphopantothenoylcysteine decarboxylase/phosphopantothenate--cysteine ligase CoaBC [Betaproteobacteria bacterium]